jgi:hypothetical protein
MISNLLTKLFQKRCPTCKAAVQVGAEGAVRRFGKWFCSKAHADKYEWKRSLDKAFTGTGCGGGLC